MNEVSSRRRAPFQVLVYPYRVRPDRTVEVARFRRANDGYWQGIAGGGDEGETSDEAARREAFEEAGIETPEGWVALEPVLTVPVSVIRPDARAHWPGWRTSLPYYPFAVELSSGTIRLSAEHTEFRWTSIGEPRTLVRWDNDRIVLTALTAALSSR